MGNFRSIETAMQTVFLGKTSILVNDIAVLFEVVRRQQRYFSSCYHHPN